MGWAMADVWGLGLTKICGNHPQLHPSAYRTARSPLIYMEIFSKAM